MHLCTHRAKRSVPGAFTLAGTVDSDVLQLTLLHPKRVHPRGSILLRVQGNASRGVALPTIFGKIGRRPISPKNQPATPFTLYRGGGYTGA